MATDIDNHTKVFHENLDIYRYPQTVVCDTVNAALSDLNEWRRREIIPKCGYEKRGRIIYTGAMLLRAGFLAELAPIIGPSEANRFADVFLMSRPFDLEAIKGKTAIFQPRQGNWFDVILANASETLEGIGHAKIVFPIGRLVHQWILGAELRLHMPADAS